MNGRVSLFKNIRTTVNAQLYSKTVSFVLILMLARFLGVKQFGEYNFLFSMLGIVVIALDFGLTQLSIREVSRNKDVSNVFFSNVTIFKSIGSCVLLLILGITSVFTNSYGNMTLLLVSLTVILSSYVQFYRGFFKAYELMGLGSLTIYVERTFVVGSSIILLLNHGGLKSILIVGVLGNLIDLILVLHLVRKSLFKSERRAAFSWLIFYSRLLKPAAPFGLSSVATTVYFQIDSVILGIVANSQSVGIYNAAYRLIFSLFFLHSAILSVVYPKLSQMYHASRDELATHFENWFKILFALSSVIYLAIVLLSKQIILVIYGSAYGASVYCLDILMLTYPFIVLNTLVGTFLNATDRAYSGFRMTFTGALFNLLTNIVVIPRFGYIGASIATLTTELLVFVLGLISVSPNVSLKKIVKENYIFSMLVFLCSFGIYFTTYIYQLNQIVTGGALLLVLFVTLRFSKTLDFRVIRSMLR